MSFISFNVVKMAEFENTSIWAEFLEHLQDGGLWGIKCKSCRNLSIFPRIVCNVCFGQTFDPIAFSGRGQISTFTHVFVTSKSMIAKGFGTKLPYCSGIITLEEGPRVPAIIVTSKPIQPSSNLIGSSVFLEGCEVNDNKPTFVFRVIP